MSGQRLSGATTQLPSPVRSASPSPEPCLGPQPVDEDVMMSESGNDTPAANPNVPSRVPEPVSDSCLQSVAAASAPIGAPGTASTGVDTYGDDQKEDEEWEDEDEDEEDGEIDAPSSTSSRLFANSGKPPIASPPPPPRAAPAPLRFERPVLPPHSALTPKVKVEDEYDDGGLWEQPSHLPEPFFPEHGCFSGECLESESTTRLEPEVTRDRTQLDRAGEISMNLTTGAETTSLELQLTAASGDAAREYSAAPTPKSTFDFNLKVTTKGPASTVSISAAWRAGAR